MLTEAQMLSPCPFSKGYKIPVQQAWFLLKAFYVYRLVLTCLFLGLYYSRTGSFIILPEYSMLYLLASYTYLMVALVGWGLMIKRVASYATQAQLFVFTDIFLITLIMHACGGIVSGVGALMLVSTAAGGLLIGGRCAMLFAAIASLFIFAEQAYVFRSGGFKSVYYPYAGLLGAAFFIITMLSYFLAKRTEQTALITSQQLETIVSLEELNQYIIQNMKSGIMITDQYKRITQHNNACSQLLAKESLADSLAGVSLTMDQAFDAWLHNSSESFLRMEVPGQADVLVSFMSLPTKHALFYMITLDDVALYSQRVQKSKLASLGMLSANIAHEIRNPLGAISHAGQLLAEGPDLSSSDIRLTEIICTQALRVSSIIEDVLQLSRRSDSEQERINLATWLPKYLINFEVENRGHQSQFNISVEDGVQDIEFDSGHLTQILNNLCENALKYGYDSGKKIELKVTSIFNQTSLQVVDHGLKLSKETTEHLFEPFFTTSSSGTGLGLYISRELAELNQASLSYQALDEGSCFCLYLTSSIQT